MIPLSSAPQKIKEEGNKATFEIKSLYPGYGATIGNSLRRVLLSSLSGSSITEVKIKGATHQFSTLPGVYEDTIMIIQNLKKLRFKFFEGESHTAELKMKGDKKVKGKDFQLPTQLELVNPDQHIATLTGKKSEIEMEIKVEKGVGYEPVGRRKDKKGEIGVILIDAIYTPVKRVNFKVENMRVGDRTDFDRLTLEIETDGTVDPEDAFKEACKIIIDHYDLFLGEKSQEEKNPQEETTKKKVEDLDLSTRTLNALTENNIKTVGGILKKKEQDLLNLEGFGEKSLKEIKKILKKLKLELKK